MIEYKLDENFDRESILNKAKLSTILSFLLFGADATDDIILPQTEFFMKNMSYERLLFLLKNN